MLLTYIGESRVPTNERSFDFMCPWNATGWPRHIFFYLSEIVLQVCGGTPASPADSQSHQSVLPIGSA